MKIPHQVFSILPILLYIAGHKILQLGVGMEQPTYGEILNY